MDALRRHHPAVSDDRVSPGQWVTMAEWCNIDLLALEAWQKARVIGYEVKVSRGDMRAELLDPTKRMEAVSRTTQFYFAVPTGLLKPEEIAFDEPDWSLSDFERASCPGVPIYRSGQSHTRRSMGTIGGRCVNRRHNHRGRSRRRSFLPRDEPRGFTVKLPVPAVLRPTNYSSVLIDGELVDVYDDYSIQSAVDHQGYQRVPCPTCGGLGYAELSRVEREAPILWVPRDAGLVEVDGRGVRIVKIAPRRKTPKTIVGAVVEGELANQHARQALAHLARHTSFRPDPRHAR